MATFKVCVRSVKSNGPTPVYIRVGHQGRSAYIRTDYVVGRSDVGRHGEVRDTFVVRGCLDMIDRWSERLKRVNVGAMDVNDIRRYLAVGDRGGMSFSEYADRYVSCLEADGHVSNAGVYRAALNSLVAFSGGGVMRFGDLGHEQLRRWIGSLSGTQRARSLYPICIRQIYRAAMREDSEVLGFDVGCLQNPWDRVAIPQSVPAKKRAVSAELCRLFFSWNGGDGVSRRGQLGRDVAMMSLCLAGMNSVDIFNLRKSDFYGGIIHYRRSKTRSRRSDEAYFEVRVPDILHDVFERYYAGEDSEYLFRFAELYGSAKVFNVTLNVGIREVCRLLGIEERISFYTFRHSWATVAQNEFGVSLADVGFAMNHSGDHRVTRGYVKFDFSPAWELNEKVIDFIFFSNAKSKQGGARDVDEPKEKLFGLSPTMMVYARAYFRGEVMAEVSDIGFGTVEEVIGRLAQKLPDTIPEKCAVQFRIKNVDTGCEVVYERTKGNGC